MNEQALNYSYELFKKDGYTGTLDQYKELIGSNKQALDYSYTLFKNDGYSGSVDDFNSLISPTVESPMAIQEQPKKKEDSVSPFVDGGSGLTSTKPTETIMYGPMGAMGLQRTKEYKPEYEGKSLPKVVGELGKTFAKGVVKFPSDVLETAAIATTAARNLAAKTGLVDESTAAQLGVQIGGANVNFFQAASEWKNLVNDFIPTDKDIESGFWGQTATALGQMVPIILTGGVSGGGRAIAKEAGKKGLSMQAVANYGKDIVSRMGSAQGVLTVSQVAAPSYEQAKLEGATENEAIGFALQNAVMTFPLEMLPVNNLFKRLDNVLVGNRGVEVLKRALVGGVEEGVTEGIQNIYENVTADAIYGTTREFLDGVGDATAVGGTVGAIMNGLLTALVGRRARATSKMEIEQLDKSIEEVQEKVNQVDSNNSAIEKTITEIEQTRPRTLSYGSADYNFLESKNGDLEYADDALTEEQAQGVVNNLSSSYKKIDFTIEEVEPEDPYQPTTYKIIGKPKTIQQDAIQEQAAGEVPVQSGATVSEEVAEGVPQAEPQVVTQEAVQEEIIPEVITGEVVSPEVITEDVSLIDIDFDEEGDLTDEGFTKAETYLKSIIEEEANNAGIPVDILLKHYNINSRGEYFSSTTPIIQVSESNNYQRAIKTLKDISFRMFPDKIDELNTQINNYSQELLDGYERGDKGTVIDKSHGELISALDNINDKFNQFINPTTQEGKVQEEVEFNEEEVNLLSNLLDKSEAEGTNLPEVFQLETTTDNEAKKQSLVESATKLMDTVSDDLSSKSSPTNAPTMEPTPIVITENTELTNKVPRFPLVDLIKKRINLVMADQLKVGDGFMGGPLFPLIEGIFGKAAWASINLDAARKIVRGAINGDYSVVFNMNPTAVDSNTAFMDTFIKKLNDAGIKENILVELKSYVKDKKFGKKTDQIRKITEESTTIDEFSERLSELDVDTISDFVKKIIPSKSVVAETAIGKILQSQNITQEDIRDEISEQLAKDLPMGAMTTVLKITDANGNPVTEKNIDDAIITPEQQKAEGIPSHRNYPFYVRGSAVGILDSTVPFWNMSKAAMSTINAKVAKVIRNSEGKAYSAAQARAAAMRSASMKASKSFVTQPPTKSAYQQFIERLSKAIPSVEVVTSQKEFDDLLTNLNAKSLATKNQKIYGAVLDGKLYLNPSLENFNTPIHEFAHVWTNTIKELSPEIYQKGIELIKGSEYVSQIEASKDYKRITDKMRKDGATDQEIRDYILEEALATAVGDKGESFATASQQRNFKNWLNDLFQFIKKLTGISKLTPEQIQDLSLDEFLNSVVVDLLSEKPIFKNAEVKNLNNQLQLMARPDLKADDIVKIGLANGFSEGSIRELLKRRGFTQEEINRSVSSTVQAAKKVEVTEEFAPGYDRVLNEIFGKDGVVAKSRRRGRSEEEAMQNAIDYLQQDTKVYENATDVQREAMVRNIRKEFKKREKAAPSAEKIVGKPKKKQVTVDEMAALKDQIKLEARAAREAKGDFNTKRKMIADAINKMATEGKITTKKAEAIVKRASRLNVDSEVSVNKFIDYVSKVFADAEYASKLSTGNALRNKIKSVSKNKDKSANLRDLGVKFSEIDPSMVEDIEQYNTIAKKIFESINGSTLKGGVKFADIVKVSDVSDYINDAIEKQNKEILNNKIAEMSELLGIEITEDEYFMLMESINNDEALPKKYKDGAIRKAFDVYSAIINQMVDTGVDPITGEDISIDDSKKKVVRKFMDMDLNILSDKEALAAIDSLLNFIQNGSTAKMDAVYSRNLGEQKAVRLDKKNFKSSKIKKYFSEGLGQFLVEQFTPLDIVMERMFKGVEKAGDFMFEAGISALKKGKSLAQSLNNKIVDKYFNTFYKSTPNGQAFNTIFNTVERGMTAHMMRTMPGTESEINTEFKKKKSLLEQSIANLNKGNDNHKKLADVYAEVYDKLLKDSDNYDDVVKKADPKNVEAVEFWQNEWANKYGDLSDLSESIYNKTLGRDLNYTPLKVSSIGKEQQIDDNSDELNRFSMSFHSNNQTTYQRETGVLMKPTLDDKLPSESFIDLSFDSNNANSMYDALVDLNTANAVRQISGFFNSDSFKNIVPNIDDRKILKGRVNLFIRNIRNKNPYDNDEFAKAIRGLQNLAALGAGRALAGPTQALKQTIPVIANTIVNAGSIDLAAPFNEAKTNFINNSGYAIANRSAASINQIETLNKLSNKVSVSLPSKIADPLLQLNEVQLKLFLQKPDAYVARAAWMTYYEKSLKQQGIDTKSIDYATHELNDKAADYAQRQVDRQQNISDMDLAGKFVGSKNALAQFVNKTIMPFSSFRINQSARLGSDWAALTSKISTKEDKVIAARSLGGFFVELATFRAVSATISVVLASLAALISGKEDDEEDREKLFDTIIKGATTSSIIDIVSFLPYMDGIFQAGISKSLDVAQDMLEVEDADKFPFYNPREKSVLEGLGMLGIAGQRATELIELIDVAYTRDYKDDFGRTKYISEEDSNILKNFVLINILSSVGIASPEIKTMTRRTLANVKRRSTTNESGIKQKRGSGSRSSGSSRAKQMNKADLKRYNRELYDQMYGPDSPGYEIEQEVKAFEKQQREIEREMKDRVFGVKD